MATAVYVLCGLTATVCAGLLLRTWFATRTNLLLWAGICFVGLAINNVVLFVDKALVTDTSLATWRTVPQFAGLAIFALGLVWEASGRHQ
jgi:hypothetical protein